MYELFGIAVKANLILESWVVRDVLGLDLLYLKLHLRFSLLDTLGDAFLLLKPFSGLLHGQLGVLSFDDSLQLHMLI